MEGSGLTSLLKGSIGMFFRTNDYNGLLKTHDCAFRS
jgi:hypothetical protein